MIKSINLKKVCELVGGQLRGNPEFEIQSVNSLEKANRKEITFAAKDNIKVENLNAGALIVGKQSQIEYPNLVYVEEPYIAFARLLDFFFPQQRFNKGIDENAVISPTAVIGKDVSIGAFSYIGHHTEIQDDTEVHAGVIVYRNVKIGRGCLIYSNVVIREEVEIGNHVIIQPGAIIGADGFGFSRLSDGTPVKIPQKGKVIIGSHCEIGANSCIDRSTIEETVLGDHVKLDNLVQIGHNVKIGRGTAISGLCGISGSCEIGENVIMAGQVGVADHTRIADGAIFGGKTGVSGHVKEKGLYAGIPYQDFKQWQRNIAIFKNLEKYIDRMKVLEKTIKKN